MHSPLTRLMIMGDLSPVFVTCLPLIMPNIFVSVFCRLNVVYRQVFFSVFNNYAKFRW